MAAIVRGNFAKLLEPGLRTIVFDSYKEKARQYPQYMNVQNTKKAIETDARMGGFGMFVKKGTTDSTLYEDPTGMETVQYKPITFSKGFVVEKEMVDDELYGQITKMSKALGRSARETIEVESAKILNTAFTQFPTNYKGEALIGNHTRLDGGATTNAIGNLALTEANLEVAMKLAAEQVNENGFKIQISPNTLIVPRSLEFVAEKIVKSVHLPGTNFNDINPMQGKFKVVVLDYLIDQNDWFLMDSTMNPLNFYWREKMSFKTTTDFDTDQAKFKMRYRMVTGWTDHRGILGASVS